MGKKAAVATLTLGLVLLVGGLATGAGLAGRLQQLKAADAAAEAFLANRSPAPFVNSIPAPPSGPAAQPAQPQAGNDNTWLAPEGFTLHSYSTAWNSEKLQQLYEELKKNRHGEELYTLHQVVVHAQANEEAMAMYNEGVTQARLRMSHPALPPQFAFTFPRDVGSIHLYDGDRYTTVESMAGSLSHEYGHLYTFYHMFDEGLLPEYAQLRQSEANGLVEDIFLDESYTTESHPRYLIEVAAEDYVQLMGSPTTRQVAVFPDVRQMLAGAQYPDEVTYGSSRNWQPQENMSLPLANAVPGLAAYFYGFIDEEPPPWPASQPIELGIVSASAGFNLLEGYRSFTHYTISWNTPYPNAVYTLVYRNAGDLYYYPIKTVQPGQAATATIGTVAVESAEYVTWQYDDIDSGDKEFLVVAQLEDGSYQLSQLLEYHFG